MSFDRKWLVEFLQNRGYIFRSMQTIKPKELGVRKRLNIYLAVDLQSYYNAIYYIEKSSRFVRKDARDLLAIHEALQKSANSKIVKRIIIIKSPLCSKAKDELKDEKWKVYVA